MISDTLLEAAEDIARQLTDPSLASAYDPDTRAEIDRLAGAMSALAARLASLPGDEGEGEPEDEGATAHALAQKHSARTLVHALAARVAIESTPDALVSMLAAKLLERDKIALARDIYTLYATATGKEPPPPGDGINPRPPTPG